MKLGKTYYFDEYQVYVHDPQKNVILAYRTKEFLIIQKYREIRISVDPVSITNKKVFEWIETWANLKDRIVTPSGRTQLLNGDIIRNKTEFIYFIFNSDSNAVKIGRAKNVNNRLKSLQVGSPVKLQLLRIIDVKAGKEAKKGEESFHNKFANLRLLGEWFRFEHELKQFIEQFSNYY
ncbi:MAG: GIY-YIG nuclease family protein [Xenococcaceae cyanobacterium MO_188.B29]|nr:GIY-YIG nuclease family protein [Xenococcaceae cyanobacterium MO_188.B29]